MSDKNLNSIWIKTLAQIEVKLDSPIHFKTWFQPTELIDMKGKKAIIGVKNSYASDWLKKRHNDLITDTLEHVSGEEELKIEFRISKDLVNQEITKLTKKELDQSSLLTVQRGTNMNFSSLLQQANINPSFTFHNFILGPSNRLGQAAALAVANNPGVTYNPLFIYGSTGLGKTHLAHAAAHSILEQNQGKKILYTTSETFLNEMVTSIKTGRTRDFRSKYRFLDVLIIDDIQLISKWEQTQDELFNTFNALYNKQKQIILVSDRHPEKIHNLESRLRSRFQGGMVVMVEKPDFETRLAIINNKSKSYNIQLPEGIVEFIAKNITDNVRALEGSLQQISLFNQIKPDPLSIEEVASLLNLDQKSKREKVKPKDIIKTIAKEYQITSKDILSRSRKAEIAFARQVVMYLLREEFGMKLEEIAKTLNRKDHTTVIHAVDKIKSKLEIDKGFDEQLQNIKNNIYNNEIP